MKASEETIAKMQSCRERLLSLSNNGHPLAFDLYHASTPEKDWYCLVVGMLECITTILESLEAKTTPRPNYYSDQSGINDYGG